MSSYYESRAAEVLQQRQPSYTYPSRAEELAAQKQQAREEYARLHPAWAEGLTAAQIKAKMLAEQPEAFVGTPDEVPNELYTISMDELRQKADEQARREAQPRIDAVRLQNAMTFMSVEPRWHRTPENAQTIVNELNNRRMLGTVAQFAEVFNDLAAQGKITVAPAPLPQPKRVLSEQEQRDMPLDQLRDYLLNAPANGLI